MHSAAGIEQGLLLIIVVLLVVIAGLLAAVARQTRQARHFREKFMDASFDARCLRRELIEAQTNLLFPHREKLHG